MERQLPAAARTTETVKEVYVGWEEVSVCPEKGRREIHYVLKRRDGGSDLAVIAKEKSLRHMTYRFLLDFDPFVKPKSKKEVVDWLNSFTPDSPTPVSPQMSGGSSDGSEPDELNVDTMKKLGRHTTEFLWVGSQWTCKKKRKHYQAFRRNGVKISVNQFVHALAEENKSRVAYLDDMYEDAKGNKMVVVRWFHKIDEVDIDLPRNFNDREIFFSLCLQDLNVECVTGFATVLSPWHHAKFMYKAGNALLQPYMCCKQYDCDDVKPLDITQVKGYWKQVVIRYMSSLPSSRTLENASLPENSWKKEDISAFNGSKPRKRLRLSRESKVDSQCTAIRGAWDSYNVGQTSIGLAQGPGVAVFRKETTEVVAQHIFVGSIVEVLSQDSGMRGCWFRATIIKKHKNKVKLRYHDIKDAENEAKCLEEWVLATKIAVNDVLSLRLDGRTAIRPSVSHDDRISWVINIGTLVDAWWHDGWWEGIVIQKEANGKFQVYLPGEKQEALFTRPNLRHSQEWVRGGWKVLSEKADVAASILSDLVNRGKCAKYGSDENSQALVSKHPECDTGNFSFGTRDYSTNLHFNTSYPKINSLAVMDLSKDDYLSRLKWKASCKRKRSGIVQKLQPRRSYEINPDRRQSLENRQDFLVPSTLKIEKESRKSVKVDHDNCKYITDALFSPSVVPSLTNLVMSR